MKKLSFVLLALSVVFISCTDKQLEKEIAHRQSVNEFNTDYVVPAIKQQQQKISDFVNNLTLEQKVSQLFIENLDGCKKFRSFETVGNLNDTDDDTPLVAGGYLYFSYNVAKTAAEMRAFNNSIKDYCDKYNIIHPFLAIDQEGGLVARLKNLNPILPSNELVANSFSIKEAYHLYVDQARSMENLGFHMNLAPVVEICTNDNKDFLDGRSFGNPWQVFKYGRACINAYENNNIATVLKHFPGNTNTDPHTGLPVIKLSKTDLIKSLEPFIELLRYNPEAVLMSHAVTDAIDPGVPACLSSVWVTDILRNELGYEGIIFSDDIFMGALANNGYEPEKAAVMAIDAGIDCIMISEKRFAKAGKIIYEHAKEDSEFAKKIDKAVERIIKYKVKAGIIQL